MRATLARTILAIDPEAAQRRREQAQKDPRIRRWREDVGTAALAGYGLPPADVLEADLHLTERALDLREAGLPGTLGELRARAYLDALLGRHPTPTQPAGPGEPAGRGEPANPGDPGAASESAPPESTPPPGPPAPSTDAAPSAAPAALTGSGGSGGRLAARINVTVPLMTLLGLSSNQGDIGGFGPIDPALARDITARAATHPSTSWSLTITHTGQAIAHGPIPSRRARRFLSDPSNPGDSGPGDGRARQTGHPGRPPGPGELTVKITPPGPRQLLPPHRRVPLRTVPAAAGPRHRPHRHLLGSRLPPPGRPMRPGPHHSLRPRRPVL